MCANRANVFAFAFNRTLILLTSWPKDILIKDFNLVKLAKGNKHAYTV